MNKEQNVESAFRQAYESDAKRTVEEMLKNLSPELSYHGASHTLDYVYPEALVIATAEGLNDDQTLLLAVAALFHDVGFLKQYHANEPLAAEKASEYAATSNSDLLRGAINVIAGAILTTNMQSPPSNHVERIIRDADLSILGKAEFLQWNTMLREEVLHHPESPMYAVAIDNQKWATSQLRFLENHQWFTAAAKEMYQAQKEINIQQFKNAFREFLNDASSVR